MPYTFQDIGECGCLPCSGILTHAPATLNLTDTFGYSEDGNFDSGTNLWQFLCASYTETGAVSAYFQLFCDPADQTVVVDRFLYNVPGCTGSPVEVDTFRLLSYTLSPFVLIFSPNGGYVITVTA